jgi:hypothetical protein
MALSWLNLPCALKAAIDIGGRTLGNPRQCAAPQGAGAADSLDEAKAAFRASVGAAPSTSTPP